MKSVYETVRVQDGIVYLVDLNPPSTKSVTNDAERVYVEVKNKYPNNRVVYRDTMGNWDEIEMEDGTVKFLRYEFPNPDGMVDFFPY
jgi:hypothetical protein